MVSVLPDSSTYTYIEKKVRRLTASASEAALSSADIQEAVNRFYTNDFPYAIKMDQQRSVYKFLTIPNVDRYPVNVNDYQGFRAPVYFEGIPGNFFKNRDQLFNLYPRYPTQFQKSGTLSGNITNASQAVQCQITSVNHQLLVGSIIVIQDVVGMTELNGNSYTVVVVFDEDNFSINVDSTAFTPYVSGGTWTCNNTFSFTLFGNNQNPFPQPSSGILSTQVIIGGIDVNGNPIRVIDDGGAVSNSFGIGSNTTVGQLIYVQQNTVGDNVYLQTSGSPPVTQQVPSIPQLSPLGGQVNANSSTPPPPSSYQVYPPSPLTSQYCGTVNYVTTQINLVLPAPLQDGSQLNIWAATYQVGRPYNLLFWNNELTIRPVPDNVYLVEVEAYQTPAQFMLTTSNPVLNQWAQYIAYGAAMEILRDRQDMEGVDNLRDGFNRQEGLVLERQANEEIQQPNITIFNTTTTGYGLGAGYGVGF